MYPNDLLSGNLILQDLSRIVISMPKMFTEVARSRNSNSMGVYVSKPFHKAQYFFCIGIHLF